MIKRNWGIRCHGIWKRADKKERKQFLFLILLGFFAGAMLFFVGEGVQEDGSCIKDKFVVEEGLEIHEEILGVYKIDALLPSIVSNLRNATDLGAEISSDFYYLYDLNKQNVAEAFSGWKEPNIQVSYEVTKEKKVYDIAITTMVSSIYVYDPVTIVNHYYYDVEKQKIVEESHALK